MPLCECGCGGETQRRFCPGHDAQMRSRLLRQSRNGHSEIFWAAALEELARRGWLSTFDRRFGVEIEFFEPSAPRVLHALRDADIEVEEVDHTHEVLPHWKLVMDPSVTVEGHKLISPILHGRGGLREIYTVVKAIKQAGAQLDKTCGFHVHHDVIDLTKQQIARIVTLYRAHLDIFQSLYPEHRNDNEIATASRFGTIEFRSQEMTFQWTVLRGWVRLTQALVVAAKRGKELDCPNLDRLLWDLGVPVKETDFLQRRYADLQGIRRPLLCREDEDWLDQHVRSRGSR